MGREQPLISVIMPVYNAEDTVERAIQSVIMQTYSDWELLIVDDGSTDNSGAICDCCAENDARIRVCHTPNAGVSCARNTALQAAKGEWIAFLDSDDWYDRTFLQVMLDHAANVDMVICMHRYMPEGSAMTPGVGMIREYGFDGENALSSFIRNNAMFLTYYVWNKLIRKSGIQHEFHSGFSYAEDTLFVLENMQSIKHIAVVSDCLYNYTRLPKVSLSKKLHLNTIEVMQKKFNVIERILGQDTQAIKIMACDYCEGVCNYFLKLVMIKGKSRQDKLLVMRLQINETLFLPIASYGEQCNGIYRLFWRALRTQKPEWIYFVFSVLGKPYNGFMLLMHQICRRHSKQ